MSPLQSLFGGSPAHMRREEMIAQQQAMAQEATLMQQIPQMLPKQQTPAAPQTAPVGPGGQTPLGPSQSFLSAAAATPQQNVGTKTLLGA